jgi:poly-gamma-glutamate synthesis protein (capsule biosynthesis protein)
MSIILKEQAIQPIYQAELLFGGDFCPIGRYEEKLIAGEEIFDSGLLELFTLKDLFIVNLEAPLCSDYHNPKLNGGGLGTSPEVAKRFKELNIDGAGLANNHIIDKGKRGVEQTQKALDKCGIRYFGAGLNQAEAEKVAFFELNNLKIGILAVAEKELNISGKNSPGAARFHPEQTAQKIADLKHKVDFLVCYPHAGHEFMLTPSPRIRESYRAFIDAGADAVVGHHPHVPQGYEEYKNGWIFYSLGNLVFDSPYVSNYADTDHGYLVKLAVSKHKIHKIELIPYRLTEKIKVEAIKGEQEAEYASFLQKISNYIKSEDAFSKQWKNNVAMRWEQDYCGLMQTMSQRYIDDKESTFLSNLRNLFTCPTHQELLEQAFDMIEAEQLKR